MNEVKLTDNDRAVIRSQIATAKDAAEELNKLQGVDARFFSSQSDRNLALVSGTYWETCGVKDVVSINHLAEQLRTKHALITSGKTKFIVTPRSSEYNEAAQVAAGILNYLWDALDFDRKCDQAEWDSYIHPMGGVVEIGWEYKPRGGLNVRGERGSETEETDAVEEFENELKEAVPPEFWPEERTEEETEQLPSPEKDDPFIERFDPRDFFVDPQCKTYTLEDAQYVFRRKLVPLEQVKSDPRFKNTDDLKPVAYAKYHGKPEEDGMFYSRLPEPVEREFALVELYDGYIRQTDGDEEYILHVVMASNQDKELLAEKTPYPYFRRNPFPFEIVPAFIPNNDKLGSWPDASRCRDVQVMHDLSLTQVEWTRGHTPNILAVPFGIFAGVEGEEIKRKLRQGKENQIIECDPSQIAAIRWLDRPEPHLDSYRWIESAADKIREIIGVSEYQSNILPSKRLTATEASMLAQQGGTRQLGETARYNDFIVRCAYKVLTLIQQFTDRAREYAIQTDNGGLVWQSATPEQLRGIIPGSQTPENPLGELEEPGVQFTLEIDPCKGRARNELIERQQAIELLQVLVPYVQMADPRLPTRPLVNIVPLIRGVVTAYNMPNMNEVIPDDPTPQEIAAYQMQLQQMMMQQMGGPENAVQERSPEALDVGQSPTYG